jgi:hypothetical protein
MTPYPLTGLLKFLLGILLVQLATGVQVLAALHTQGWQAWWLFALLSFALGLLAALWFTSILHHSRKDAVAGLREDFSREREKIRVQAERAKARVVKQSHQQILKERDRTQTKAGLKVGTAFAVVAGLGGVMLLTQFVTFGLLTLGTAGGALAGYALRARQDARRREQALAGPKTERLIGEEGARKALSTLTRRRDGVS